MRKNPSITELQAVKSYTTQQRLQFFLTRVVESEEIWGLGNTSGWVIGGDNESYLPVWPYSALATECATGEWEDYQSNSVSLEHFVYSLLPLMEKQGIQVEILPAVNQPGIQIKSAQLATILEQLMESGEYFMEG